MNARTLFAGLASAALLLVATGSNATPVVNIFVSPGAIQTGGTSTLSIQIYDDVNAAFTNATLSIAYPPSLVNVGGTTYDDCGGTTSAGPAGTSLSVTNFALSAGASCFIDVPVTAATAGTYTITAGPSTITSSNGPNVNTSTTSLTVVAPLVVTTTADSGAGSLRDAITTANGACQTGLAINFNIPGAGPHTIQPLTALPGISCNVTLDGFTQSGAQPNTQGILAADDAVLKIILDGSACGICDGLLVNVSGVTIKGLAIRSFGGAGIEVTASGTGITGNYIGTDPGGMTDFGNGTGVHISAGYALIGGVSPQLRNLITGNGVGIHSQSGAIVSNTQVGGARDMSTGIGNSGRGIFFNASNSVNSVSGSRIIGNGAQGISVDSATVLRTVIQGVTAYANGGIGIDLNDDGATPNDESGPPYDTDTGPNRLINYPVITSVAFDGFNTTVTGYVKSEAFSDVTIYLYTNDALTANTQGQAILDTFSGTLDANGFLSFTRLYGGSLTHISAQMTADTCGDGCVYSSEFSPSVAQAATLTCNMAVQVPSVGDGIVTNPTVIAPPGAAVTVFPLCFTQPTTFSWSTGATTFQVGVTAPAAGASATYSVDVSDGVASGTFSVTLQGAAAGTPVCTIDTTPPLPIGTTLGTTFTVNATCSPAATGFTWPDFGGPTDLVSGQGTASAGFQVSTAPEPGVGYHIFMDPTNAAGPGPSATRIIWFEQVAITAPASMDFGTVAAGTISAPQSVTFQNLSQSNSAYGMNVTVAAPYATMNNCPNPLPPSATCTIDIVFAPTVAGGPQTATASASYSFPGNPGKSISLTGNATGAPGVMFTPAALTFASRTVFTTSTAQTLTLANNGTSTLGITSIAISGDFAYTTGCPASLAPGASCTIDVTFTPLVVGARSGTLTVADTAAGSPHTVALNGTGLSTAVPVLDVSPSVVEFSAQPVGTGSAPQVVIVSNTGNAPLTFGSIAITGEFAIVAAPGGAAPAACPVTLGAGESCRIDVVFHPAAFNGREGSLTIATDAGTFALRLFGTGLVPEPAQLEVPASLDFGAQAVGTRSAGRALALHNISPYPANVSELTASGDFSVSDTCTTIPVGATCSPVVTFQPAGVGPREGLLTIQTLRDLDPYFVRLTGTGNENHEPALELSVTRMGFGNAFVGQLLTKDVVLKNVGQATLLVFSILATGDYFTDGSCVGSIAPGSQCTVHITFVPSSPGGHGGSIVINSNAPESPHEVTFTGTGCFLPSPSRARFGALLCGS
jgi:hypothetical protein